jgi:hypothetical protein
MHCVGAVLEAPIVGPDGALTVGTVMSDLTIAVVK